MHESISGSQSGGSRLRMPGVACLRTVEIWYLSESVFLSSLYHFFPLEFLMLFTIIGIVFYCHYCDAVADVTVGQVG